MFEDTNQAVEFENETDDFSDLFTDDESEVTDERDTNAPEAAEAETDNSADEPTETAADTKPESYTVRFNGEDVSLSFEDLVKNAQKGMNYDHVVKQRDDLRNSREMQLLDRFAKESGMTREQYLDGLEQMMEQRAVAAEVEKGVPEEAAKQLVQYRKKEAELTRKQKELDDEKAKKDAREKEIAAFVKAYPDVKEFPKEVLDMVEAGENVLSAYRAYENKQLKAELAAARQNAKNRETVVGSMQGDGKGEEPDDFLAGFDSF